MGSASGWDGAKGTSLAFGSYANPVYKFDAADVVLAIDADLFCVGPGNVRYSRDFIVPSSCARRQPGDEQALRRRIHANIHRGESRPSLADHVHRKSSRSRANLLARCGSEGRLAEGSGPRSRGSARWWQICRRIKGSSLVFAGEQQSAEVHALAFAINEALGNSGKRSLFTDPVEAAPADQLADLSDLCADLDAGAVDVLMIVGGNPVYNTPADLEFAAKLQKARLARPPGFA